MKVMLPGVLLDFWQENPDEWKLPGWLTEKVAAAPVVPRRSFRIDIELDTEEQREELDALAYKQFMDEGSKQNNLIAKAAFAVYHQVHKYERNA
ncbi:hypothetical protein [Streptomyces sp. NPDC059468]|uniref:hypothetical protein n=1 Tax=Streptomyces sp. NPDC059468 TaxID=3346845 RepID=UPI0036A47A02